MTFAALLTKELRLRLRRERSVWLILIYLSVMGILGFFYLARMSSTGNQTYLLSQVGGQLYYLLAVVQLLLILFIAPAFTATTINGEKERQTFDLLLCSRLSSFSLLSGKLIAGLANALLLIAASIPIFSLVFFFGGISPSQVLTSLLIFVGTAVVLGTFGLFCSTLVRRPPVSTVLAYMFCVLWLVGPWVIILFFTTQYIYLGSNAQPPALLAWNPIAALVSTLPGGQFLGRYTIGHISIDFWVTYTVLNVLMTIVFFLLSMWFVKPNPAGRLQAFLQSKKNTLPSEDSESVDLVS